MNLVINLSTPDCIYIVTFLYS